MGTVGRQVRGSTAARSGTASGAAERLRRLGITRREGQVLALVLRPLTNAQVATQLGVSKRTVESHVSALLRKFAVADRAALIRAGARLVEQETGGAGHQPATAVPGDLAAARLRVAALRQQVAYARAVHRERESINVHETAADHLDVLAAGWRRRAEATTDLPVRAEDLHRAALATQRALAARTRAERARERLLAEGIEPNREPAPRPKPIS